MGAAHRPRGAGRRDSPAPHLARDGVPARGRTGIATSPSLFTLSYGSAPAVFAFLLGRRGTAMGAALLSTRNGAQAASVVCEAGLV
ncbi:hypothetical protein [Streptomyces sp. NPDC058441]|uniref:hypothetical protein n=1 Tax=Streptomyces sp. NPDC058441 TaxID=3346502 RepID=UPI003661E0E8